MALGLWCCYFSHLPPRRQPMVGHRAAPQTAPGPTVEACPDIDIASAMDRTGTIWLPSPELTHDARLGRDGLWLGRIQFDVVLTPQADSQCTSHGLMRSLFHFAAVTANTRALTRFSLMETNPATTQSEPLSR